MKCTRCRGEAWVEVRRHNAAYCDGCFVRYFHDQVARAIRGHQMFGHSQRVLVAVSGGKDSLALWDALIELGYQADGLYVDLGIGEYSGTSKTLTQQFAAARNQTLHIVDLDQRYGVTIPLIADQTRRAPCSGCGLAKRYLFNRYAAEHGYDVLATGHNLDDEAATLLGNLMTWQTSYLARQHPVLEAEEAGLVRKVKPLYRLTEHDTASYAVIRGLEYVVEECPNAVGARSIAFKEALNLLEQRSPGAKQTFLLGFLEKGREAFSADDPHQLRPCSECGQPTTTERCAFCRLISETHQPSRPRRGRRPRKARRPADAPASAPDAVATIGAEAEEPAPSKAAPTT
ncbi:MAG: adenine nucleotide alpha hydrolase family protein [Chloroflexi bacterium]|nr:adenine nucleotide alpha hydrolase family protein [Chloroflexota bacterium]